MVHIHTHKGEFTVVKYRAYLSTFNFSRFVIVVVFFFIVQSSELISVWFRE